MFSFLHVSFSFFLKLENFKIFFRKSFWGEFFGKILLGIDSVFGVTFISCELPFLKPG